MFLDFRDREKEFFRAVGQFSVSLMGINLELQSRILTVWLFADPPVVTVTFRMKL